MFYVYLYNIYIYCLSYLGFDVQHTFTIANT